MQQSSESALEQAVFAGTAGDAAIAALCRLRRGSSHDDIGDNVDAMLAMHALGALGESEADAVDLALAWDAACRRAFHEHLAIVGELCVAGEPVAPPPRVYARLVASVDALTH